MSIFIEKNGKKRLPRSFYIKLLIFFGLITLSILTLQPVQAGLSHEMQNIRDNFIHELEEITGMDIRYSSIRPAFFGSFDIRNLRFYKNDETFFTVQRIKIEFSVLEILLNKKTFIHTVRIDRPVLQIDTIRDKDTFNFFLSLINIDNTQPETKNDDLPFQRITEFLPKDADYQIRGGFFSLSDTNIVYQIDGLNLNIREEEGKLHVNGRLAAEYKQNILSGKAIILRTDIGIDIVSDNKMQEALGLISFFYINCYEQDVVRKNVSFFNPPLQTIGNPNLLFNVLPFSSDLSFIDNTVKLSKPPEIDSFEYNISYNFNTGSFYTDADFNEFITGSIINFSDNWKDASHLLGMTINGIISFYFDTKIKSFSYHADLTGENKELSAGGSSYFNDSFIIRLQGNDKIININDFYISSSPGTAKAGLFQGSVTYSGSIELEPLKPRGTLIFNRFSLSARDELSAVFNVTNNEKEIYISSENISIANAKIDILDIYLYPSEKDLAVSISVFSHNDGAVFLDAVYNVNPRQLEASLMLDSVSLYEISEFFRPFTGFLPRAGTPRSLLQRSFVNTEIFFSTDFNNFVYNAPSLRFNIGNTQGMLSLTGTDHQFNLTEGILSRDNKDFLITANSNFSNPSELIFAINASYMDLAWQIDGQIFDRTTLIIRDNNGLHVYGDIDNFGGLSGYIEGINYPVYLLSQTYYLNFYSTLRYSSINFWALDVNRFAVRSINTQDDMDFLVISGTADQDGASFTEISINDIRGSLFGNAGLSWNSDFSYVDFLLNIKDENENGEFYYLEGTLIDEKAEVQAAVSNMHLHRYLTNTNYMILSADTVISWDSVNDFDAHINISSFHTIAGNDNIYASVAVNLNNDEILVNNLRLEYARTRAEIPEFRINREEGFAYARADFNGFGLKRNFEGRIELDVNFKSINSWLNITEITDNFNGTLFINDVQHGHLRHDRFAFIFSGDNGAYSFSGGINDMIRIEMDSEGHFFAGLSAPLPIRGAFAGTLKNGIIDAYCNNYFIDLSTLYSLVDLGKDFNIVSGYLTGHMNVRGPVLSPEYHGTGRAASLRVQVPGYISEDIRTVPFSYLAEGYEMTFGPVDTLCGNGGGTVSGWFIFQNWYPIGIGLNIVIPRDIPVPYNFNITGFLANGNASGNLNITYDGINRSIDLNGNLFSNDAELGLNIEDIASQNTPQALLHSFVDLTVTAGSMVEFVWPNVNPIIKANPERGTVIHILADTQAGQFSLDSNVRIRSGEIYYFDRSFFIRQGNIVFKENETSFDPLFSVRAEIRDRAESGPVTISMIVDNQPLLSFEPRFEARPSLTQLEIYSILGQNFNVQGEDNTELAQRLLLTSTTDLLAQVIASSDVLSQFVFFRQFEKQVRDTLKVDMFSVRTRFINNLVVSSAAGRGETPVDRETRVGNYFDNTTVFIGKYIGQHMFIHGMLTMRYDENSLVFDGLRFEPDIGIELQSPFVNIRWDFFPYHPQNWWVNDNSITLSWSMSF